MRAGTESVAQVVAMAEALRLAYEERERRNAHAARLRDRLVEGILAKVAGAQLTGHPTERLPNNASFVFEGTDGESILLNLDEHDVCASSGSACTSGTLEVSHVLKALGLPLELARGSLRLTTGQSATDEDVARVVALMPGVVERVRAVMPTLVGARE
jgi:cysteine desulfurase